jgi:uncharacterized protein (DUF1330 family)
MFRNLLAAFLVLTSLQAESASAQQRPVQNEQTASLPGYLLVVGKTTDRSKIGAYAAALPPIYASHSAYYLSIGAAGRGVSWLEGPWQDRSLIFGKFPNRGEVDRFWWGEAYRTAIRKRDNAGVFSVVALQGTIPVPYEGIGAAYLIVMSAPRDATSQQRTFSARAADVLQSGVLASGGQLLTSPEAGAFTSMEGDTPFDRFIIAAWPTLESRDAYLTSRPARQAAAARQRLGLSVVVSANGVARTQAPPAAAGQASNR